MDGSGVRVAYTRPNVKDYGDLLKLTGDLGMLHVGIGGPVLMAVSTATSPGGAVAGDSQAGSGQVPAAGQTPASGQLPAADTGGANPGNGVAGTGSSGGGGGGSGGGGGGGGNLPFTGLALGAVAAVGGALSAAGVGIRRWLRRERA
jgi:hypothetical protein